MRIVFMGTTDFSVTLLCELMNHHTIELVVTQPDRPFGRKQTLKMPPVKEIALAKGLPVFQPEKIKLDYQPILDTKADIIVVAAYGQMIPKALLNGAPYGCINVHASLLPKYRGGSPMHTAIKNGERVTGVTIMKMVMKMDAGDIYDQAEVPIEETDDVGILEQKLAVLGGKRLVHVLSELEHNTAQAHPQDEALVTFAWNIKPEEERLNFNQTTESLYDHVRAYHPWPLTYLEIDGNVIKVLSVSKDYSHGADDELIPPGEIVHVHKGDVGIKTLDGRLYLKIIQPSGRNPMAMKDYMNGAGKSVFVVGKRIK